MSTKKGLSLLAGLLVAMLLELSACGSNAGVGSPPGGRPDSVSIQIDNHRPTEEKPVVTLTNALALLQRLLPPHGQEIPVGAVGI